MVCYSCALEVACGPGTLMVNVVTRYRRARQGVTTSMNTKTWRRVVEVTLAPIPNFVSY